MWAVGGKFCRLWCTASFTGLAPDGVVPVLREVVWRSVLVEVTGVGMEVPLGEITDGTVEVCVGRDGRMWCRAHRW